MTNRQRAYVQALPKPSGCKVYIINQNNTTQAIAYLVEDEKIILQLQKQSSNTSISNNNACYSLAGAVYGIYTDAACTKKVGEITTNANGFAAFNKSVYIGTYYAKEITAPKGFALSREVLTFKKTNGTDNATGLNVYNFFEASIASGFAFFGCRLRGIIFLHPCRRSTKYICPELIL